MAGVLVGAASTGARVSGLVDAPHLLHLQDGACLGLHGRPRPVRPRRRPGGGLRVADGSIMLDRMQANRNVIAMTIREGA